MDEFSIDGVGSGFNLGDFANSALQDALSAYKALARARNE